MTKYFVIEKLEFVQGKVENMRKGEEVGYNNFLLFPYIIQKALSKGSLKVGLVLTKVLSNRQLLLISYKCSISFKHHSK